MLLAIRKLINTNYGFEKENASGAILGYTDLNKLLVIGSSLNPETDKNGVAKALYEMILKYTGHKSDGVIIFDEDQFDRLGIDYLKEPEQLNHFDAGSETHLSEIKALVESESKSFTIQPQNNRIGEDLKHG